MTNELAEKQLQDTKIRFLFIDGDHTKHGVEKDIDLFFPKLMPGSIIVFDDYSQYYPEVVETVDKLVSSQKFSRVMTYKHTLVLLV